MTTIVLADDHALVRAGVKLILDAEAGLDVVAEAADVDATVAAVIRHTPDILILDLNMPGRETPLEALPTIREHSPQTSTIVLTMQEDAEYARRALQAGAAGYVLKNAAPTELVDAVYRVVAGEVYLTPMLGARLALRPEPATTALENLTCRELDVLKLVALGFTNTEVGERLYLSLRTVETERARLNQKLGCATRSDLVRFALDNGVLDQRSERRGAGGG